MIDQSYGPTNRLTARLEYVFEERKRSWIMLLIYNEEINALYMRQSSVLQNLLLRYYSQTILNLASICLDSLSSITLQMVFHELAQCHGLEKLDLSNNNIGAFKAEDFQKLCDAITLCHNLKSIDITKNNFNKAQKQQINQIAQNKDILIIKDPEIVTEDLDGPVFKKHRLTLN